MRQCISIFPSYPDIAMATRKKKKTFDSVWERPEQGVRPPPEPLHREAIVRAAVALADEDGIDAVSLRKVASALEVGPMRLYTHFDSKEELFELMIDTVYSEMWREEASLSGSWREVLREVAQRMRAACHAHPWFAVIYAGRPHQGPHAFAHHERALAALCADGMGIDEALRAAQLLNAYVLGALLTEEAETRAERETGMSHAQWQEASFEHISRMLKTGEFPTLERVMRDASHPSADELFAEGVEAMLDGLATRLTRQRS